MKNNKKDKFTQKYNNQKSKIHSPKIKRVDFLSFHRKIGKDLKK